MTDRGTGTKRRLEDAGAFVRKRTFSPAGTNRRGGEFLLHPLEGAHAAQVNCGRSACCLSGLLPCCGHEHEGRTTRPEAVGRRTFFNRRLSQSREWVLPNETEAGGGGTSYFFSVYYGITGCGVDCGCESYQVCSCQFDGGTGCPTYGGICWCEVQCGCQLYRI